MGRSDHKRKDKEHGVMEWSGSSADTREERGRERRAKKVPRQKQSKNENQGKQGPLSPGKRGFQEGRAKSCPDVG